MTTDIAADLAVEHRSGLRPPAADTPVRRFPPASRLTVVVRQARSGDSALLADIFDGLSPASRLSRFLVPKWRLTAAELHYFTDVDHHEHEAVIALTRLRAEPVGIARFVRHRDDPTSAEVAVEVVDEWQGRGVGSLLGRHLAARARGEGVARFTALMSADNTRSKRLLEKLGTLTVVARDGATVEYRVTLPGQAPAAPLGIGEPCAAVGCA
ncbi:MAG: GNAT family N-acetyltransferase [Nocardioides sp.]